MSDITYTREGDRNKLAVANENAVKLFYWHDGDGPDVFERAAKEAMHVAHNYAEQGLALMRQALDAQAAALLSVDYAAELLQLAQMLREGKPIVIEVTGDGSV